MLKSAIFCFIITFIVFGLTFITQAQQTCLSSKDEQNMALCARLPAQGDAVAQNTLGEMYYQDALLIKGYHAKTSILFEQVATQCVLGYNEQYSLQYDKWRLY